jgi:hypothetical protein
MKQHFVTFYSPGTFCAEMTEKAIESWDVAQAVEMSKGIVERYDARPYGFRFNTRERLDTELDSRVVEVSPMYYLGGKVQTLAEIEQRNDPEEDILRSNMRSNGYSRVISSTSGWKFTQPLKDTDIVLEM